MDYTVRKLLKEKEISGLKLICSEEGIDRKISGITILETADIANYLNGGEVLLTGLYAYKEISADSFHQKIHAFDIYEISAFILKLGKEVVELEEKVEILKKYCIQRKIPLIQMPPNMYYWEIIYRVMAHVYDKETVLLRYFKITHDNFTALSFLQDTGTDKIKKTIEVLASMVQNPVGLYYSNLNSCFCTEGAEEKFSLCKKQEEIQPAMPSNYHFIKQGSCPTQYFVKFDIIERTQAYLVVTEKSRSFKLMDCIAMENAIVALMHIFLKNFALDDLQKKYNQDIVHNLLIGRLTPKEMEKAANFLGIDEKKDYRIVVFRIMKENNEELAMDELIKEKMLMEGKLETLLPGELIFRNMEKLAWIQEVDRKEAYADYHERMEALLNDLQSGMEPKKKLVVKIGIGRAVKGVPELKDSYREAEKAVNYMEISKIITGEEDSLVMYSELGFVKLLAEIDDPNTLLGYVPETLRRLYEYNKPQRDDLLITLETYLDLNESITRTAQKLYVHYKTVSYRIDKIQQITGMDLKNPNEMLMVRIGLMIYKIIENRKKK